MKPACCLAIGIGLLFLSACGKTQTLYPVTAGSYQTLPKQPARVVVWGRDNTEAVTAVAAWLQKRGLFVVEHETLHQALGEVRPADSMDEKVLLQTATLLGIDDLVLVETSRISMRPRRTPDARPNFSASLHSTSVTIKGINAKTGHVEWNASASFPPTSLEKDDVFESLACQALATVWGFRPAGYHKVSSTDMCAVKPLNPYEPHAPPFKELGWNDPLDRVLTMKAAG